MKQILKFTVCILLFVIVIFISCKKELSCEGCKDKNKPPIANAGTDQTITLPKDSVLLDGNASKDADGTITSYKWLKIAGPVSSNITKPDSSKTPVKTLVAGVYKFELTVTDNGGLSAKDTLQVMVDAPGNQPPVACAGADQTIILPTNSVNLDGTCSADPDNNIISYSWTISGLSANLTNANAVQTQVTDLVQGVYQFELKVTDAGGLFSKDTVMATVNALPPPVTSCDNSTRQQVTAQLIPIRTLSKARAGMAVASAGNKIVFAGGQSNGCTGSWCEDWGSSRVDIYDVSTNSWSIAELSAHRYGIAAIAVGNKIFFAGGEAGDGANNFLYSNVDIYDVSTNTWS
ncbi:MAG: PKD domain-containing protein, partial [Chitinophagaceae bacterium]